MILHERLRSELHPLHLRTFKRIGWELSGKKLTYAFKLVQIISSNSLISVVLSAESRLSTFA